MRWQHWQQCVPPSKPARPTRGTLAFHPRRVYLGGGFLLSEAFWRFTRTTYPREPVAISRLRKHIRHILDPYGHRGAEDISIQAKLPWKQSAGNFRRDAPVRSPKALAGLS